MLSFENIKIAVIGQGNVGLPLAIAFGKKNIRLHLTGNL